MGGSRWHAETFVCAVRGHVSPAGSVRALRPEDAGLGIDVPGRGRLARCLRCDAWVQRAVPPDAPEVLPALDGLSLPRRGRALRDAIVLRVIAVDRAVHSVVFGLLALGLFVLDLRLGPLKSWAANLLDRIDPAIVNSGQNPSRDFLGRVLRRVLDLKPGALKVLIVTAALYCLVEGAEAVGLWLERRWAEYLTALATAGFLPFEVHELLRRVTALRLGAFAVNVAILVYLVWAKRLFGVRGGAATEAGEEVDRVALFGPPPGVGTAVSSGRPSA